MSSFVPLKHKQPKLLSVVEAMGGGIFTYIVDLSNLLVNSFDLYLAYGIRPQTPSNYKNYFDKRIHLIEVQNFTRSLSVSKDFKAFFEIKKIAKDIKPNIIHLHSSKAGVLGRWAFNGHKIPLFYTPHGYSFLMTNYGFVKRTLFRLIETVSAWRYCTTISCSKGEHQETLKFTKSATYVDNGIDIGSLQKLIGTIRESGTHPFTAYTLGRICNQKNPKLFNKIAERLPNVRFIWIGDGELRNQLTAPNIAITGWKDRTDVLKLVMDADVFLLTSLWEGLPISLLESMFMKKPCVVSDVIGNQNVIKDGVNGYLCSSVEQFVSSIGKIASMSKEQEQSSLTNNAYQDIVYHYNSSVMAKGYRNIYMGRLNQLEQEEHYKYRAPT
ncbi:glycosyltransferase [Sporolactobacillus sp. CQH2019]|uniref:glycosyltransferase n=1 Tax=Sporolactobacillus sp. CQH2019 TaxID=3023512 RepID=UPI002367F2EF|nr:glycosyltransferase [Sporolactobacillus sp. CQH2019]MDD9148837.1 glycosyltransferase [Sporolactobacillus sp. CQH2019]